MRVDNYHQSTKPKVLEVESLLGKFLFSMTGKNEKCDSCNVRTCCLWRPPSHKQGTSHPIIMTSLVPVVGTTIENASLKNPKQKCKTILASAEDDEKEQMRRRKKNQKPYYAGSWVFSEQGRGRADCYPIITVTQWWWLLYKILLVKEEKTAEKSNNKSIWNWYINRGTKSVSMGKCVWLGIFYWDESTTWIELGPIYCCWLPNDHCCHLTVACYYTTMNGTGLCAADSLCFVGKTHNVWKTFMIMIHVVWDF